MEKTKVVLVDDHPLVLQGFKVILESLEGVEVVATSDNGEDGMKLILEHQPDIALLDIMLPGSSGLELMRQLQEHQTRLKVIFITASDSEVYLADALRQGASGYLSKDSSKVLIECAVRGAQADGVMLSASLVGKAFGAISKVTGTLRRPGVGEPLVDLSTRKIDVLRLIAQGKSDAVVRKELTLTDEAVKEMVLNLRKKLGTRDRISTALQGMRLGLVE